MKKIAVAITISVLSGLVATAHAQSSETVIRVDPQKNRGTISPFLFGTNHRYANNGIGTWNPEARKTVPAFDRNHREAGLKSIRYPGGTVGNTFEWKKAIGPVEKRPKMQPFSGGGTPTGLFGEPNTATFGVDEAARWCEENRVEMIYMFGIAFGTPEDAADLVEYLNMPVGKNPNGGVDWAKVRAQNGHPTPYNIRYFEIANEADGPSQRYWWPFIDSDETRAKSKLPFQKQRDSYAPEYLFGGMARFEKQLVGSMGERGGRDFRDKEAQGNGTAHQRKVLRYVPLEPGSDTVFVGGEAWKRVANVSGEKGNAYQIDPATGTVLFGDGVTGGNMPAQSAVIRASYRAPRSGFVDYYRAMKAVDPALKIYAGYESRNIITTLGDKHPYDGVVIHPYTTQYNVPKAPTLEDWHHNLMLSSDRLGHEVHEYQELIDKSVAPARKGQVHMICTEFGAIVQDVVMPPESSSGYYQFLNIGLYTGLQLMEFMRVGIPQAHRHATTVGVFGPAPRFEPTASAEVYRLFTRHFGDRLVGIHIENNPLRETKTVMAGTGVGTRIVLETAPNAPPNAPRLQLTKLQAEASRDAAGNVYVVVVNRDAIDSVAASVALPGLKEGQQAETWTLNGSTFAAFNTPEKPNAVTVTTAKVATENGQLRATFPAHSLTFLKFPALVPAQTNRGTK